MAVEIASIDDLESHIGRHLGYSSYLEITQERIDLFARATDDFQWIHTDPEKAAEGPFGKTIAHGFLTLSLVSALIPEVLTVSGVGMGINYGCNKVRFPAPVPVGSRVRLGAMLAAVERVAGGVQVEVEVTVEVEDAKKPSLVAGIVFRYYS